MIVKSMRYLCLVPKNRLKCVPAKVCRWYTTNDLSKKLIPPWRILFFGTDEFALESLKMLVTEMASKRLVQDVRVVCAHPRCAVAKFSTQHNLNVLSWKPSIEQIQETGAHVGLVASFGHLIPLKIISAFPLGMVNVHASLLPKWRGAAPIVYAIMNREKVTGVTIMRIRPHKFDEGEVIGSASCSIGANETAPELTQRLAVLGAGELKNCLLDLPKSIKDAKTQSTEGISYAPKVGPSLSICDWSKMTADEVYARHLALAHVFPLQTWWKGQSIKLLDCRVCEESTPPAAPGSIVFDWRQRRLLVVCSEGTVTVTKVKVPERPPITATDFLNGYLKKFDKSLWRFDPLVNDS